MTTTVAVDLHTTPTIEIPDQAADTLGPLIGHYIAHLSRITLTNEYAVLTHRIHATRPTGHTIRLRSATGVRTDLARMIEWATGCTDPTEQATGVTWWENRLDSHRQAYDTDSPPLEDLEDTCLPFVTRRDRCRPGDVGGVVVYSWQNTRPR